jgi:energy-coupling factor transporter ATP-binding protein EcfA2
METRGAAYLPQLPERALAGRNLAEDLTGIIRPRTSERVVLRAALKNVGLSGVPLSRRSPTLSAGERRRLSLALLLLSGAGHWALDEPEAALDAAGCRRLLEVLGESLRLRRVRRLWIATHQFELYQSLHPWAIVLDRGQLLGQGDLLELLGRQEVGHALGVSERAPFRTWNRLQDQLIEISSINLTDPFPGKGRVAQVKALLADRAGLR